MKNILNNILKNKIFKIVLVIFLSSFIDFLISKNFKNIARKLKINGTQQIILRLFLLIIKIFILLKKVKINKYIKIYLIFQSIMVYFSFFILLFFMAAAR